MPDTKSLPFDIFIIGGGINGCGIARDAAGRGYSTYLCEMNDLASGTSSWSSKLIHGGFRYLEYYEFRLVREALGERETLMRAAPHIISPMRFVLPHHKDLRPAWLIRLGLFIYDHMGHRKLLPPTKSVNLKKAKVGKSLQPVFSKGFEYSDCAVDDARLVVLNARDAADKGARVEVRTKCVSAEYDGHLWNIETENSLTGKRELHQAKLIVNAAGPWVDEVLYNAMGNKGVKNVRLVQGSHIVVPRLFEHDRAYIFQNKDERVIFAIPYQEKYTLIGTTDHDYEGDPAKVAITPQETRYLCEAVGEYFQNKISEDDIVWSYSGVRPLYDDGASKAQEATRDYVIKSDDDPETGPLLNIFGGKITTYRKLAESMMDRIAEVIGTKGKEWTANATLPGGDFDPLGFENLVEEYVSRYPFLEPQHIARLVRLYGTKTPCVLGGATTLTDLGKDFGMGLYQKEVEYLIENEWAKTVDDIIFRRTKLGIGMNPKIRIQLTSFIKKYMRR